MKAGYHYSRVSNANSSSSQESIELEMTSLQSGGQDTGSTADYGLQIYHTAVPPPRRPQTSVQCKKSTVISLMILIPIGLAALVFTILLATGVVTTETLGITKSLAATSPPFVTCAEGERRCDNGYECLNLKYVCNGKEDCSDNSDERGCEGGCTMSSNLYYHCKNGDCVKINWRCDREPDCVDKDDEIGCEKCDNSTEFTCNNYECVALHARCDGIYDCEDHSDEYSCFRHASDTIKYLYNGTLLDLCYSPYIPTAAGRLCAQLGHRSEGATSSAIPRDDDSMLAVSLQALPADSLANNTRAIGTFAVSADASCRNGVNLQCQACGESTKNIWAGYLVGGDGGFPISDWPWQVKLSISNKICGGTILADRWILTAAHCVSNHSTSDVTAVFGTNQFSGEGGVRRSIKRIILHPNFSANFYQQYFTTYSFDLALLEVKPIKYNSDVQPACLPTQDDIPTEYTPCYITGFGSIIQSFVHPVYPAVLQEGKTRVWNKMDCKKEYSQAYGFDVPDNWLCAGYRTAGVDSCGGDSGGPLVCLVNRHWVLQGVVSWGSTCKQALPSIYARVSAATDWIRQHIDS